MSEITIDQAKLEIEAQAKRFSTALTNIAEAVRRDIIGPFCDKHKLSFVSAMGAWSFEAPSSINSMDWDQYLEGNIAEDPDDPDYTEQYKPPDGYAEIRELLTTEVYGRDELFEYMEDYDGSR